MSDKHWIYPEYLYCDACETDVKVDVVERRDTVHNNQSGQDVTITYTAAVCPHCGKTVCERDYHLAFLRIDEKENKPHE